MKKLIALPAFLTLLTLAVLLPSGCKKDAPVSLELLDYGYYLARFNEEAKLKGMNFEDELRKLKFKEVTSHSESGNCEDNTIVIPEFYQILGPLHSEDGARFLEQFIFHALGHCILGREHDNSRLPNGEWKSLMREEPFEEGLGVAIDYNGAKREYYISELFDRNTVASDFFYDQPVSFETGHTWEWVYGTGCGAASYSVPVTKDDDYEIRLDFFGETQPSSFYILFNEGDSHYWLYYDSFRHFHRLLLRDHDYGPFLSFDFMNEDELPTANSKMIIRKTGKTYSFFLDDRYLFQREREPGDIEN